LMLLVSFTGAVIAQSTPQQPAPAKTAPVDKDKKDKKHHHHHRDHKPVDKK
jgi:hypothetical protein